MDDESEAATPVEPFEGLPRRRRWVSRAAAVLVIVAVLVGGAWASGVLSCSVLAAQPDCWVAMLPGPTRDVDELIEVDGVDTYGSDGDLLLTTVLVDNRLSVAEYVEGLFSPDIDLLPRDELYGPDRTVEDARFENEILMSDSQLVAKIAALDELGIAFEELPGGAEIVTVVDDSPATETELEAGDVIVAVDDQSVDDVDGAVEAIGSHEPEDVVTLTLLSDDEEATLEVELGENPDDPGAPFVGVLLRNYQELPIDVAIDAGSIGGPSAGLVFSLGIVDRATPEDLTDGRDIAATGTIATDGRVGPIGGIVQKIVGAADAEDPVEFFLVPSGNWEEAQTAEPAEPMTLVEIATLREAVDALEQLANGDEPANAVAIGPPSSGESTTTATP